MTFEEWWKSYDIWPFDLMDDYEDYPSEYKVKELCSKAYEAGWRQGHKEGYIYRETVQRASEGGQ